MSERRYSEEEVAAIFARATEAQEISRRPAGSGTGITLSELQGIGREVGIDPEAVAHAAALIEQSGKPTSRRFLGLPIGVGKTIELHHHMSDSEWERLVVDLRETFAARGRVSSHGSLRQWTNGNLQVLLEPTATGHRLRMHTVKGSSGGLMMAGLAAAGFGVVNFIGAALGSGLTRADKLEDFASLLVVGLGAFALGAVRLPSWARLRSRQMDDVIARLPQLPPESQPSR